MKPQDQAAPKAPVELPPRVSIEFGALHNQVIDAWIEGTQYARTGNIHKYVSEAEHQQEIRKLEEAVRAEVWQSVERWAKAQQKMPPVDWGKLKERLGPSLGEQIAARAAEQKQGGEK